MRAWMVLSGGLASLIPLCAATPADSLHADTSHVDSLQAKSPPPDSIRANLQPANSAQVDSTPLSNEQMTRMAGEVHDIHKEVVESPLQGKSWGVEVDPLYLLFLDKGGGFAGTISNFSINRSAEIAFPVDYENMSSNGGSYVFNLDAHYRYFLAGRQRGFYLSGFARFQTADYRPIQLDIFSDSVLARKTLTRAGVGFELGSRIFSRVGWYWGWSIMLGRYFVGDSVDPNDLPDEPSLWLGDLIFDVELLKIGFAF